jgi:arylsulfatase A-like enzyme
MKLKTLTIGLLATTILSATARADDDHRQGSHYKHVLLISVDGLHEVDVDNYIAAHPFSAFARLRRHGVSYTNASTSKPSDSFPGLVALVTGASPRTSGVYYDDSYDRKLSPPGDTACAQIGTEAQYAENIDLSYDAQLGGSTRLDAGGGIDPNALPRDPANGCAPYYPRQFLRVNTIFNVAHKAGLYTAWSDKHPAYELVRGRANTGAEDLYTPEINSPPHDLACTEKQGPGGDVDSCPIIGNAGAQWTSDVLYATTYDNLKVKAVLNEIEGLDSAGKKTSKGVPAIFGMNFQSVSVGQKLTADGYSDAAGTPSVGLAGALDFVNRSLGRFLRALEDAHIDRETLVIVSAKHGQSPIDVKKLHMIEGSQNPKAIADVTDVTKVLADANPPVPVSQATEDDISLLWLSNQRDVGKAIAALQKSRKAARVQYIVSFKKEKGEDDSKVSHGDGPSSPDNDPSQTWPFDDPLLDSRTPDLIVQPIPGTIYSKSAAKIAEHGGFAADDTHTALILFNPSLEKKTVSEQVTNEQVAPTILRALGLNYEELDSVKLEGTRPLPEFSVEHQSKD